ncbi:MAG TPA: hypothetical protein PLL15_06545 [Syntrophales bacterium]|jgi:hypothetical protein|nr:hypothetical protein [Syntrophales bacterium]
MAVTFPFLTSYDPPGIGEGSLDPLGLYQIADKLAVELVPGVRERMHRIRFLTAMALGTMVTEGLEGDPMQRDASPFLVWEWLVVEALIRQMGDDADISAVPGTLVTKRAIVQPGYLDARGYLKTPRVFGFHGVYKRLAVHLGIADVHLGPGPHTEGLADAWARDMGFDGVDGARSLLAAWKEAVRRSLGEKPPRTKPGWSGQEWARLAAAFAPGACREREKRYLRDLLHATGERRLGALPAIWRLQDEFAVADESDYPEERLHDRLEAAAPEYARLLAAIRAYETFARSLQDGFDVLKAQASTPDAQGYDIPLIAQNIKFRASTDGLDGRFEAAHRALGEVPLARLSLQGLFVCRFDRFAQRLDAVACARALCDHHREVQREKSAEGKRPWFDDLGEGRIYIRQQYREPERELLPGRYVHDYRGRPIRRFYMDLK